MAPEHLESIHTASTEKSDVYSFAIVVWVIVTGEEPYASELERIVNKTYFIPEQHHALFEMMSCLWLSKVLVISVFRCQERRPDMPVCQEG